MKIIIFLSFLLSAYNISANDDHIDKGSRVLAFCGGKTALGTVILAPTYFNMRKVAFVHFDEFSLTYACGHKKYILSERKIIPLSSVNSYVAKNIKNRKSFESNEAYEYSIGETLDLNICGDENDYVVIEDLTPEGFVNFKFSNPSCDSFYKSNYFPLHKLDSDMETSFIKKSVNFFLRSIYDLNNRSGSNFLLTWEKDV
jgi:hypothetical protein